jgi:hypothetical protein
VELAPVLETLTTESPMGKLDEYRTWNGFPTKILAEAAAPGSAWLEVTVEVVLISCPSSKAAAVTFTMKVQFAPAARVAPVRLTTLVPAIAVMVPPSQVPTRPLGLDTSKPVGSVSEKASPVRVTTEFGFVRVNARPVVPPGSSVRTFPKLLVRLGGVATVKVAVAVFPVPKLEVTAWVVLTLMPSVEVMGTTMLQELAPAIEPLTKVIEPAASVTVPPHVFVAPPETVTPAGKLSTTPTPLTATPFGLVIVSVSVDVPPGTIFVGLNDLVIDGGETTRILSVSVATVLPSTRALIKKGYDPATVPVKVTVKLKVRVVERSKAPVIEAGEIEILTPAGTGATPRLTVEYFATAFRIAV